MSVEIARFDDSQVRALLDAAETVAVGIGGTTKTVHIAGTPVFVKQLPITRSEETDPFATDNSAGLPFACHYGIGSPSCGVGREVAAHQLTSEWVDSGEVDFFPLLLGCRIVDLEPDVDLSEFDGDGPPQQWGTSWPLVERRLTEMKSARSSMVLFLEYVPETLGSTLHLSLAVGRGESVFADAVDQIIAAAAWMEKQGFHHFDLTTEEESALTTHSGFDRDIALMHLFHWVLYELGFTSGPKRLALLRAAATDPATPELEPVCAGLGGTGIDLITADASVVVRMTEMFTVLMKDAFGARYDAGSSRS
ncbi:hypothetical protein [Brevibacterium zhoupengii]|uniref:hypothetical protein n=1 Tax=Brevibacterium zhoupengii TaxID=2898795 RepID=UPI001E5F357B|nr:hypothetical protein [Brevibacterium zhoupengii]